MAGKDIPIDLDFKSGSGVVGYFSWRRLSEILRAAGELKDNERIKGYYVTEDGVKFYTEEKG